jgi:hypothetical protein
MMFCTLDTWLELSMSDIRRMEEEAATTLRSKIKQKNNNTKTEF